MIAKLIVHGVDREHARRRMLRALDEFVIEGPKTLLGFHKALLEHECFVRGETCHGLVESDELAARAAELDGAVAPSGLVTGRTVERCAPSRSTAAVSRCASSSPSSRGERSRAGARNACTRAAREADDAIVSPMQGTVLRWPSPTATGRDRPGHLHRRGDEDGERSARAARRCRCGALGRGRRAGWAGQVICVLAGSLT